MHFGLVVASIALGTSALAQEWAKSQVDASPRHLEWVDVKYGERTVKTFVAYPEVKEKATVVVLIHEIFGMSDWVMLVADQLAAAGYIAVAPDFLSGMGPNGGRTTSFDASAVREAMSALPASQVDADLDAACDYAKKIPAANGKVTVAGFCWGGSATFRFATKRTDLKGAFVFYGTGPTDEAAIKAIKAPVYGFYGEDDARVNATIPESERTMKANGKKYEPVIYAGAGHGFMRAGAMPDAREFNATAKDAAWKRWLEILRKL